MPPWEPRSSTLGPDATTSISMTPVQIVIHGRSAITSGVSTAANLWWLARSGPEFALQRLDVFDCWPFDAHSGGPGAERLSSRSAGYAKVSLLVKATSAARVAKRPQDDFPR